MKEIARYLGTCPVCAGEYKLVDGRTMVHHGYKRPGHGAIVGDCYAVAALAYELSCEATKNYRELVQARLDSEKGLLVRLTSGQITKLARMRTGSTIEIVEVHAGEPDFPRMLASKVAEVEWEIRALTREVARLTAMVDSWVLSPVKMVHEEAAKKAAERADSRATKAAEKVEKLRARVEGFQKRIDSAVRRKNASALATIFESITHNLRTQLGGSKGDALAAVGRDNVWIALGFVLADGTLADRKALWAVESASFSWPADLA